MSSAFIGVIDDDGVAVGCQHDCGSDAQERRDRLLGNHRDDLSIGSRAILSERQQQLDQVQHVDRAILVDVLRIAAGDGGQSEAAGPESAFISPAPPLVDMRVWPRSCARSTFCA